MKLAITGKGGVGKTTVSALVAYALRASGQEVFAIDADPDSNLLASMGHPEPNSVPPLVELRELIRERTGAEPGTTGGMFRLNPEVGDIPERYGVDMEGVRVLVAGAVRRGGSGCYCPENALLRALVSHLLLKDGSSLVLDMEAGIEHLGRGTLEAMDRVLVVVDPGRRSVETAARIGKMAADIGLERIGVIGNKIRSEGDRVFLRANTGSMDVIGFIPYDEALQKAERLGKPVFGVSEPVEEAVSRIVKEKIAESDKVQQGV